MGVAIKRILRSRLPERLAGKVPPALVELGVGALSAFLFLALRLVLTPLAGDRAPYAFVFLSVAIACVVAGWRSGLLALIIAQASTWLLIVASGIGVAWADGDRIGGFIIATISQIILLLVIALYQREVDKGSARDQQRLALLDDALKEIDHRTRNNYQTVMAMVDLQARRSTDVGVRDALRQVADRIQAIANASQQLARRSSGLDTVRLEEHLCGLVDQIERGLSREEITVDCNVDDVTASPDAATSISIIVNELVTNAIKHAFNGEGSGHVWVKGNAGSAFELIVADDGRGIPATRRGDHSGLGSKLVESFARQLGAAHEVVSTTK